VKPAPTEEGVPQQLPPFDVQAALLRTNGKPKLLRKLMLGFRDQYTGAIFDLREHVAAGRDADAERLAHSLKSVAAMLEARDLAEAASSVELAFRSGKTANSGSANLAALIATLERELDPIGLIRIVAGQLRGSLNAMTCGEETSNRGFTLHRHASPGLRLRRT
jgi:HPt (histidine-containing phosphotransfer) domain-containing protein